MKINCIILFIILSIILLELSPVKSSITVEEQQPANASTPRVLNTDYYDDNTIVVRLIRVKDNYGTKICLEEYLSIRTIFPNGTIKAFDVSLDIQPINFCLLRSMQPLRFFPVKNNFLLLTYTEAEDLNNPLTYYDWGMVIDLDGVIHK
jgi:hypothetical protein